MDPSLLGWLSVVVVIVMLPLGIPVAFILGLVGVVGSAMVVGSAHAVTLIGATLSSKASSYTFIVLPLFILMSNFFFHAGFATDSFDMAKKWLGGFNLGVAYATMLAYAIFAASCGNSIAACAAMTKIVFPEFERMGYDKRMGAGVLAAGGTLAPLIPPSMLMVIYGIIAEASIAKLLIAGIMPGITLCLVYMMVIFIKGKINPNLGTRIIGVSWRERFLSLKNAWSIPVMVVIIMGGIYSGIFTPTEAGAVGAFGALIIGTVTGRLRGKMLIASLLDSAKLSGSILLIIATAFIYGVFLSITRLPYNISELMASANVSPMTFMLMLVVFFIIVGMFLDMIAAMLITLPVLLPTIRAAGFDLIWFGVIMVQLCEIALLTPPFGLNLFTIKAVQSDLEMVEIIKGVLPFIVAAIVGLLLFIVFPQIALFLPSMM